MNLRLVYGNWYAKDYVISYDDEIGEYLIYDKDEYKSDEANAITGYEDFEAAITWIYKN